MLWRVSERLLFPPPTGAQKGFCGYLSWVPGWLPEVNSQHCGGACCGWVFLECWTLRVIHAEPAAGSRLQFGSPSPGPPFPGLSPPPSQLWWPVSGFLSFRAVSAPESLLWWVVNMFVSITFYFMFVMSSLISKNIYRFLYYFISLPSLYFLHFALFPFWTIIRIEHLWELSGDYA